MNRDTRTPLLTIRTALVLLLAALVGLGAGSLTRLGGQSWSAAVMTGIGAAGGALLVFDSAIE